MSLIHDAKMPSLKDKLAAQAEVEREAALAGQDEAIDDETTDEDADENQEKPKKKGRVNKPKSKKDKDE